MRLTIHPNSAMPLFTGICLMIMGSCSSNHHKDKQAVADTAVVVTVSQPATDLKKGLSVSGVIEAVQSANISTRVMGYITSIKVNVGDRVSKGQLLLTISNDDILAKGAQADAMIAEANAGFINAQKDFDRFNALYKQQSASAKELDNVTLQYKSAKARLDAAKQARNEVNATLSYTNLTAPFAGLVTQKMIDAGSMANPGMPLLTIEQSGSYQVSVSVPESEIGLITEGTPATVTISAAHQVINGKITQIGKSSQNSGGQYIIKIHIPDYQKQGLFAGMYANVAIPLKQAVKAADTDGLVMVPVSAIEYKNQLTGLYTISSNHTALLRWVRLGKTSANEVEVLSGLAANEPFIVSAEGKLYDGVAVKIK
ncbi:efflux RND transporter periplasmic adaptor subunit [Mucilaginibacter paludis]|uniref:Efflux transporter, RND family, MFP subunit n=1 Tax=Mucilaginibacter paludis DSM 18603 TaxID=714943 RepID=H1YD32_9SPHI|nr:efflux RND transporter periplasmic adaptor subunit [Mucilaginibacter paludis]EHQ26089.1 efflux transporter, RND family, MFP subunit [Mucilaginibacter paludis DSM 18603]